MHPLAGNTYGVKLKDKEVRQEAYRQYCAHLAKGKSKRSFVFEHPELTCHWQTIESYMKDTEEFNPIQKEVALCKGYAHWEQVVEDSATGVNEKANTASLQMKMRNQFNWDKDNKNSKNDDFESEKKAFLNKLFSSLTSPEKEEEKNTDHTD